MVASCFPPHFQQYPRSSLSFLYGLAASFFVGVYTIRQLAKFERVQNTETLQREVKRYGEGLAAYQRKV